MKRTATCSCSKTSITVEGEPVVNAICSCDDCKRRTGAAFGWSSYFDDAQVVARQGAPKLYDVAEWAPQHRYFCAHCGTTLYWTTGSFPGLTGIAGGCFSDPPLPAPKDAYRDSKRCAWVNLPSDWECHV